MVEDQSKKTEAQETKTPNVVSDKTGQYDARFMLWRMFCDEHKIPVETLPGDLSGDAKEKWEKVKERGLKKPDEQ
ncbi:MAG: hypothetical protein ACR2LC_09060 [Pyrinomonadaceae bacterium]